jgi:hypothetical protein
MTAFDEIPFQFAKSLFPTLRKELSYRKALLFLDRLVDVYEVKPQFLGHASPHGTFSRAHETNQVQVGFIGTDVFERSHLACEKQ